MEAMLASVMTSARCLNWRTVAEAGSEPTAVATARETATKSRELLCLCMGSPIRERATLEHLVGVFSNFQSIRVGGCARDNALHQIDLEPVSRCRGPRERGLLPAHRRLNLKDI